MPESCSIFGELMLDAAITTSRLAAGLHHFARHVILNANGALALEQDAVGEGVGDDLDVAAFERGTEIGVGGRPADAPVHGHLHGAEAFLLAAVVVSGHRVASLAARFDEGLIERIAAGAALHMHGAVVAAPAILAAMGMFHALEIGLNMAEAPARSTHLLPGVEVPGMAPDIDHAVDRGRAAQHLAARCRQTPAT